MLERPRPALSLCDFELRRPPPQVASFEALLNAGLTAASPRLI
jgi:hypothetical protein